MLTVMCPNCRHRFPAPGCCESEPRKEQASNVVPGEVLRNGLHSGFNGQFQPNGFQGSGVGQSTLTGDCVGLNGRQNGIDLGNEVQQNGSNRMTSQGGNVVQSNLDASCIYGGFFVPRSCVEDPRFINGPAIIHQPIIQSFGPVFQAVDVEKSKQAMEKSLEASLDRARFEQKPKFDLENAKFNLDLCRNSQNQLESLRAIGQGARIDLESPRIELQNCRIDLSAQGPKDTHLSQFTDAARAVEAERNSAGCHMTTTCDLTGGSVTITTPRIQSGGCVIQSSDSGILMQTPHVEIRPALSGGGCFVQKKLSENSDPIVNLEGKFEDSLNESLRCESHAHRMFLTPPSGCQELPGSRRGGQKRQEVRETRPDERQFPDIHFPDHSQSQEDHSFMDSGRTSGRCCNGVLHQGRDSTILEPASRGVQIQVNATVQLPASLGQCTVNITATTNTVSPASNPRKNNFNGGGLVQENDSSNEEEFEERRRTPTTPVSWLMPCPWSFDYVMDCNVPALAEVKRLLHTGGWYHEGLSWQQSENLLKDAEIGRWLMRDSSDSRFIFAVSVQTARGPTSVRVHYIFGRFRLDAEPRLAFAMPLFDCPIKMLEYYVDYSKSINEHRKEVWVDYSGRLYSEIYLTRPLIKEVRSLSHLARLVVNRCKLATHHLPPLIRNYLAEYPYTI